MFVIGNGESRKHINLDKINQIKIGCNAVFRDWQMDHLICCDRKMVLEALHETNPDLTKIHTRAEYISMDSRLSCVPDLPYESKLRQDQPMHWGSGAYAVLLATKLIHVDETIHLLGFDLYGTGERINNVYKDSVGYKKSSERAVDPRYWIHQLHQLFELHPNIKFVMHVVESFVKPTEWHHTNLEYQSLTMLRQ